MGDTRIAFSQQYKNIRCVVSRWMNCPSGKISRIWSPLSWNVVFWFPCGSPGLRKPSQINILPIDPGRSPYKPGATSSMICGIYARYPYRLFRLLEHDPEVTAAVLRDPPCLWDHFAQDHHRAWPGESITSPASLQELHLILLFAMNDTVPIEAKHATLRRNLMRSIQTWRRTVFDLSTDWFLLQQRLASKSHVSKVEGKERRPRRNKKTSKRAKKGPSNKRRAVQRRANRLADFKRGHFGVRTAWTVFMSAENSGRNSFPTKQEKDAVRVAYRALSQEELARLRREAKRQTQIANSSFFFAHTRRARPFAMHGDDGDDDVTSTLAIPAATCLSSCIEMLRAHADTMPVSEALVELKQAATADSTENRLAEATREVVVERAVRELCRAGPLSEACSADLSCGFRVLAGSPIPALVLQPVVERLVKQAAPRTPASQHRVSRRSPLQRSGPGFHRKRAPTDLVTCSGLSSKRYFEVSV